MQQFPTSAQLSSWAGLCPANHESAGVKKSVRTNRGNVWLKTTLTQSAWAATNRKGSRLQSRYYALKARCGNKRAIVCARTHASKDGLLCPVLGQTVPRNPDRRRGRAARTACKVSLALPQEARLPNVSRPILRIMSFIMREKAPREQDMPAVSMFDAGQLEGRTQPAVAAWNLKQLSPSDSRGIHSLVLFWFCPE